MLRKSNLGKYSLSRNRCFEKDFLLIVCHFPFFFFTEFIPNESEGTSYSVIAERKMLRSGEGNYSSVIKIEVGSE